MSPPFQEFHQLRDPASGTFTYLIAEGGQAALIDGVWEQLERDLALVAGLGLELLYAVETHLHADHRSSAGEVRRRTGAELCASWRGAPGGQRALRDGDALSLGALSLQVLETPGHTPESLCLRVVEHLFTGDTLLARSTGRCDLSGGDPEALFDSIAERLFVLPDATVVCPGHDSGAGAFSTIGEERRENPRLAGRDRAAFVALERGLVRQPPRRMAEVLPLNRAWGLAPSSADFAEASPFGANETSQALQKPHFR